MLARASAAELRDKTVITKTTMFASDSALNEGMAALHAADAGEDGLHSLNGAGMARNADEHVLALQYEVDHPVVVNTRDRRPGVAEPNALAD